MLVLYGGIAFLFLFGIPQLTGQRIDSGMRIFYPEFYYGLILAIIVGIGWSVTYTVMILGTRKAN